MDASVTAEVIGLFERLGEKGGELSFGGGTRSTTVGSMGLGSATCFDLSDQDGMLFVHRLSERDGRESFRFSYPKTKDAEGFNSKRLSASLAEDGELREGLRSLMERLAKTDPSHHRLLLDATESRARGD